MAKGQSRRVKKQEEWSEEGVSAQKARPRFLSNEARREEVREIERRARREALRDLIRQREGERGQVRAARVEFMPAELLHTCLFVHSTDQYVQLALKPLFAGHQTLAINTFPCPPSACDFEVHLVGPARLGLVASNTLRRVVVKQSVTLNTASGRLWVGPESRRVSARMEAGSRVRLLVCLASRKFRIYVDGGKQVTADVPALLARSKEVFFYVELLGSGCVRVLK